MPLVRRMQQYGTDDERFRAGTILALSKEPGQAAVVFEDLYGRTPTPLAGLHAALTYDEAGDSKSRDRLLAAMHARRTQELGGAIDRFTELAELIDSAHSTGPLETVDLGKLNDIVAGASETQRSNLLFLIGWLLDRTGQKTDAIDFWKRCLRERDTNPCYTARTLAGASLADRGVALDFDHPAN